MDNDPNARSGSRENMLAVALVLIAGGMILFLLYLVSFGIIGNVLLGAGAMVFVGGIHYLLWGRAFSEDVAAEREALRRKDAREAKGARPPTHAIQDLSQTQGIQEK